MGAASGRATYLVFRALSAGLNAVPEPVAFGIASGVAGVMARRKAGPQLVCEHHVRRVLNATSPVVEADPEVVRRWARRTFRAYSRYWVESSRLPVMPPADVKERMVVVEGDEHLEGAMASGKGVVLALPHIGSWEWGAAYLAARGHPLMAVAERLASEQLYGWFVRQREKFGVAVVPLDNRAGAAMLQAVRAGGLVALLCDRDIAGSGVEVELFGERTTLPGGPATLALRTGAQLLTVAVYSGLGGDHIGVVSEPLDTERRDTLRKDVTRVTQEIARHFEAYIKRAPEQWHLFQPNWPSDPGGDVS